MPLSVETGPWAVYVLTHIRTGKVYVGLTRRTLAQRVSAHLSQARRNTGYRAGGLLETLRCELEAGRLFDDAFLARVGHVRQRGGICGVVEVARDQAATVEICGGMASINGGVSSAMTSVCM